MGTYYIPRNVKGETRILIIFSIKSLITTLIGALIGLVFYFILSSMELGTAGIIVLVIFAVIGYGIGAINIPTIVGIPFTKKIGGEPLSEIILRYIKFKKTKKVYTYEEEDKNNG